MTPPLPPISAYIRTLNEENRIGQVVRAALLVAREVIIVDSGSTDQTIDIARQAGAHVHHQAWLGNGSQKRAAETLASHDWLLDLDADEVITPEFAAEVQALFQTGEPPFSVYKTPLANVPTVGKPWYKFGQSVRHKLYNKTAIRIPDHPAWDQFTFPTQMKIGKLHSPILHYVANNSGILIEKINKNSSTRAKLLKKKPLPWLYLRIIFGLPVYFGKRYFLNGLWRGGLYGFSFSLMSGFGRWLRDVKMYERIMKDNGKSLYTEKLGKTDQS